MPGSSPRLGCARRLRAPRTGRGVSGDEFAGKCCSQLCPAARGWGQATLPLAFGCLSSPLLRRAGSLRGRIPASFSWGSLAAGLRRESARLFPPLPSALMQKDERWRGRGRRCPLAGNDGRSPALPPVPAEPVRLPGPAVPSGEGDPSRPIPPPLLSMPGHHAPLKYNLPGNNQRAAARAPELLAMQIAGGEAAPQSPRSHF